MKSRVVRLAGLAVLAAASTAAAGFAEDSYSPCTAYKSVKVRREIVK
jgi:hypothetical protein